MRNLLPPSVRGCHHPGVELHEWEVGGNKIAYLDGTSEYRRHEPRGVHLARVMSERILISFDQDLMRYVRDYPPQAPSPEGPHFAYEGARQLFLGRRGCGPLFVVWDTNLLIDYFKYGSLFWKGESLPDFVSGDHGTELEGLQLLLGLWVFRDIRFVILADTIDDAKKQLSVERRQNRLNAFDRFTADYG